jgi:hypothetical protein
MVFCTLEMGIFRLISEGQLTVWIRQIESENKNLFENHFPPEILGCKSFFMDKLFQARKKVPRFCKCEINSNY